MRGMETAVEALHLLFTRHIRRPPAMILDTRYSMPLSRAFHTESTFWPKTYQNPPKLLRLESM